MTGFLKRYSNIISMALVTTGAILLTTELFTDFAASNALLIAALLMESGGVALLVRAMKSESKY